MSRFSAGRVARDDVTVVAQGVTVRGDISSNSDIEVRGQVVGDSNINASVRIAEGGIWRGNLTARDVTVAGEIVGAVRASGQIEIAASARIDGTVTGGAIAVQQGAIVDGELKTVTDSRRAAGDDALPTTAAAAG